MAIEPKTFRETNIRLEAISDRIALISRKVWWVIGLLGTIVAGAFALAWQLGELRTSVAVTQAELKIANEKLSKLDEQLGKVGEAIRSSETRLGGMLTTIARQVGASQDGRLSPNRVVAELALSDEEVAILRDYFKPKFTGQLSDARLGEIYIRPLVPLIPNEVVERIPKLKGYRWSADRSGAIVIVDGSTMRVVKIIEA